MMKLKDLKLVLDSNILSKYNMFEACSIMLSFDCNNNHLELTQDKVKIYNPIDNTTFRHPCYLFPELGTGTYRLHQLSLDGSIDSIVKRSQLNSQFHIENLITDNWSKFEIHINNSLISCSNFGKRDVQEIKWGKYFKTVDLDGWISKSFDNYVEYKRIYDEISV